MHAAEAGSDDEDRYVTTVCFNEAAARTPRKPGALSPCILVRNAPLQ